jgi:hypothetical protein
MRYDGTDCALMCTAVERDVSKIIMTFMKDNIEKTNALYYSSRNIFDILSFFRSREAVVMVIFRKHFYKGKIVPTIRHQVFY